MAIAITKTAKCPKCGRLAELVLTNNPVAAPICGKCIAAEIDPSSLKQANFFCRTWNIPFDPDRWLELYNKVGDNVFVHYTKQQLEGGSNYITDGATKDLWAEMDNEWGQYRTFEALLNKVATVKDGFLARCAVKWGPNYEFEEYVQLENLLVSTLRANDISNPLQIDAIKKACRISVELDKAIAAGDAKGIKDLSSAYSSFTKTAQIDNVIEASNNDVISTVADLADEIERCGGQYHYYDNVDRDIVDKTIRDIKEYIRTLVADSTGLGTMLETIATNYRNSLEEDAAIAAQTDISLTDIIANDSNAANQAIDDQLAAETLEDFPLGGDDDDLFG